MIGECHNEVKCCGRFYSLLLLNCLTYILYNFYDATIFKGTTRTGTGTVVGRSSQKELSGSRNMPVTAESTTYLQLWRFCFC